MTLLPHVSTMESMAVAAGMNGRELDGIDGLNGLINSAESRFVVIEFLNQKLTNPFS